MNFFNRAQPRKALLLYADCMTMSGTHRIILSQRPNTIMVRRTQEAVLFCYWGQTQAWLHALTEQPNFWTRAIRMWSHNASHRANRKLWLRALSVLAYFVRVGAGRFFRQHHKAQYTHAKKVFWGNSPKIFDAYQEEWAPIGRLFQRRPTQVGLFCTMLFSTGL